MPRLPSLPPFPYRDPFDNRIHKSVDGTLVVKTGVLLGNLLVGHSNFSGRAWLFDPADAPNAPGGLIFQVDSAVKGQFKIIALKADGTAATPTSGSVAGGAGTFNVTPGQHTDVKIDGGAAQVKTWAATAAVLIGAGGTFASLDTKHLIGNINGAAFDFTFDNTCVDAATTRDFLNGAGGFNGVGCVVTVTTGQLVFTSTQKGTGSFISVTGGNGAAAAGFVTVPQQATGTGDAANIAAMTRAEAAAALNAVITGGIFSGAGATLTGASSNTGTTASIQIVNTSNANLGWADNMVHSGTLGPVRACFEARVDASVPA